LATSVSHHKEITMNHRRLQSMLDFSVSRRRALRGAAGAAGAVAAGGAIGHQAMGSSGSQRSIASRAQGGELLFTSTQLVPIEEAEAMRNTILADFDGAVEFIPEEPGPFVDRVTAEAQSGKGAVGVLGGLHGDFSAFVEQDLLLELTDLATELESRGFNPEYLELARFGTKEVYYIPWMQAMYIMAAHRDALEYLPEGLTEETLQTDLTYDLLAAWGKNINDNAGQLLGFPAAEDGLIHRFLQGYSYPSFTGGLNTTFASADAVTMWEWFKQAWAATNPQALTYSNMDDPLLSGEVLVAWDHTARLINALTETPDDFITFPAPRGPQGLGNMPALAGLAIPRTAPDVEGSRALIDFLTMPETQTLTLQEVAFFPTVEVALPTDLNAGTQKEADAVAATTSDPMSLTSLLPVGLGEQSGAYNKVFRDSLTSILIDGEDVQTVLDTQKVNLQAVLDTASAPCWTPDPASNGTCKVG